MAEQTKLNNFQKLQLKQIEEHVDQKPGVSPQIEKSVMGNMRTFGFMGDMLELYVPRVFDLLVNMVGGQRDETINSQGAGGFTAGDQK